MRYLPEVEECVGFSAWSTPEVLKPRLAGTGHWKDLPKVLVAFFEEPVGSLLAADQEYMLSLLALGGRVNSRACDYSRCIATFQLVLVVPWLKINTFQSGARMADCARKRVKKQHLEDRCGKHYRCNECNELDI